MVVEVQTESSEIYSRLTRSKKRKRSSSPPQDATTKPTSNSPAVTLTPLPTGVLLLCLPRLLAHPPNHKFHGPAVALSLAALRECLAVDGLAPDVECRAWTAFAEIGMATLRAGYYPDDESLVDRDLEVEVEKAIGKGLLLAQKNPSLAIYHHTLTLLHVRLTHWQHNPKHSRSLLKRLTSALSPTPSSHSSLSLSSTPPWLAYTAHLTSIAHALALSPPDLPSVFSTIQDLHDLSRRLADPRVTLLTHVIRLRTLVDAGMWEGVAASLQLAESVLGLSYDTNTYIPPAQRKEKEKEQAFVFFEDALEAAMAIHVLVLGVVYFTHTGASKDASPRLSHLHALLDSDALNLFADGTVDIKLTHGPPLTIKVTHPRVLYHLAYLVSAVSKRDAVGRRPKRKVFAVEGLGVLEKESRKEIHLPVWATLQDLEEVNERMVKIKADLMSELVAVSIMRSEFDDAENHLANLTAHTRTHAIFPSYAVRITLHHAHLAHALGDARRALECYRAAGYLAERGSFEEGAARAGEVALRIGLRGTSGGEGGGKGGGRARERWEETAREVVDGCKGMGATLEAIAHVLSACVSSEILSAKSHLKSALNLASCAQDNHLRALVLALVSALYIRTAGEHARKMLETCGQLAAGLGAPSTKDTSITSNSNSNNRDQVAKDKDKQAGLGNASMATTTTTTTTTGNVPLGLWVGRQFLELYKRAGNEGKAKKQEEANVQLEGLAMALQQRRSGIFTSSEEEE
ncbi:hypothetical protein BD410DRAFT_752259 [Rickenella mellea]|uniref:Anaphase-promoting complex subunit 5 n=1 Tax=Rickenella mellea TaxID=50990 RepID=A0A4Y7PWG5_9AGAM|nr:hypothetical protein BD410DRAFT_752259 [Rickenella mellea]